MCELIELTMTDGMVNIEFIGENTGTLEQSKIGLNLLNLVQLQYLLHYGNLIVQTFKLFGGCP